MSYKAKSWVYVNGVAIPKEDYVAPQENNFLIMKDIPEYNSTITGERIRTRSQHKAHLRQHNMTEIGNETKHIKAKPMPEVPNLTEDIRKSYQQLRSR